MRKEKFIAVLFMLPFFIILIAFLIAPFVLIIINSFLDEDGLVYFANYMHIFNSKFFMQSIEKSIQISFISSVVAIVVSFLGSYSLYRLSSSKFAHLFLSFNTMTSNFSGVPLAFAFMILMGSNGILNIVFAHLGMHFKIDLYSNVGANLIYIYFQIPLGILLLYPAFDKLDKYSMEANKMFGAGTLYYWLKVGGIQMMPALTSVFIILFANSLGAYATIYALTTGNFNVIPIRIAALIAGDVDLDPYTASALCVILFFILLVLAIISTFVVKKFNYKAK